MAFSIIPDALIALDAEATTIEGSMATWAAETIRRAQTLTTGRELEQIAVEAVVIVFHDHSSDAFRDYAHPIYQSPLALRSEILAIPCPVDALDAKIARLARAAQMNGDPSTDGAIRALVAEKAAKFPTLGLSYGYIGNCDLSGHYDDRSFRVFTKLRDRAGYSVSYGDATAATLGRLLVDIEAGIDSWAEAQIARLAKGDVYALRAA